MMNSAAIAEGRKMMAYRSVPVTAATEEQATAQLELETTSDTESVPPMVSRNVSDNRKNPFVIPIAPELNKITSEDPETISLEKPDESTANLIEEYGEDQSQEHSDPFQLNTGARKISIIGNSAPNVKSSKAVQEPVTYTGIDPENVPQWPLTSVTFMKTAEDSAQPPPLWMNPMLKQGKDRDSSVRYLPQEQADRIDPIQILNRSIDQTLTRPSRLKRFWNPFKKDSPIPSPEASSSTHKSPDEDTDNDTISASDAGKSHRASVPKRHFIQTKEGMASVTLIFLLVASCFSLIVLNYVNWRGTESTVSSYIERAGPDGRQRLLAIFGNNSESVVVKNDTEDLRPFTGLKGSDLRKQNTFLGLNPAFHSDEQIKSLMSDERLHNTFYGMAYQPQGSLEPACGAKLRDVTLDLALLSMVTTRVRLYGMQCNQAHLVLQAIEDLGLNMTVSLGVWLGSEPRLNDIQLESMEEVLRRFPRNMFEDVFVGNEVLFRHDQNSSEIAQNILKAKKIAASIGYDDLPIGISEVGSIVDAVLLETADIVGCNIHPFFSGEPVQMATKWTLDCLKNQVKALRDDLGLKTELSITEAGWPYNGGSFVASVAGPKHFQYFLDQYVCEMYHQNYSWYFFEAFDEPWKATWNTADRTWETQWGLFTANRSLKDGVVLPKCSPRSA
ncbi:unnamed protein product [Kuraishia capsulata CBS 1993]|uniref:glucan endo-1,3-beta-D-glucosidase n=1 Tax=Kuraishia capsulata CBS 1993 TaxID=1382522 RepID=W6MR17_9ASCO|nr:uncharacterized protein KUCA_T00005133001 [Kuraishia capsulata CBS 1993]CDK29146.1 unnamed protein product [Kuraishia capsulata CBS 1993]